MGRCLTIYWHVGIDQSDVRVKSTLQDTIRTLSEVWPEAGSDLHDFTQVVVPFDKQGTGLAGSSSVSFPGVTLHRVSPTDVGAQATNLLHENAHKRFMALERFGPFVNNEMKELIPSPWRANHRPVRNVLFALHAFTVISTFYSRAQKIQVAWATGAQEKLAKEIRRLHDGRDLILKFSKPTELGSLFLEGLSAAIEDISY